MRAVMSEVTDDILEWRRRIGADRRDEVWDGVLHMVPTPGPEHQRLQGRLLSWLLRHWACAGERDAMIGTNVSRPGIPNWTKDYRVPDLMLITRAGRHIERNAFFEGGPDAVIEIRSPGDETWDKLRFYAAVGCREVWIVDAESRALEIHACVDGEPSRRRAGAEGWIRSDLGIELRTEEQQLAIRVAGDGATTERLP
jgi:Uma2 family endonuclease